MLRRAPRSTPHQAIRQGWASPGKVLPQNPGHPWAGRLRFFTGASSSCRRATAWPATSLIS